MRHESTPLRKLIDEVNRDCESVKAIDCLEVAVGVSVRLVELSENLVGYFVDESRRAGESWSEIGGRLGVSRQATQKRFVVADSDSERFWDRTSNGFSALIELAESAAKARQQSFVGTEHVLLAMCERPRDPATAVLASLGINSRELRGAVDGRIGSPVGQPGDDDTPFTAKMLRALQLAKREALLMGSNDIETVHLALGLLAMNEGIAFEILSKLGATYETVRDAILVASRR